MMGSDDFGRAALEGFVEPPIELMPTLPQTFESLAGHPISITSEIRKPANIIELIGKTLGVNDYESNIASFWFLDFIALQVLRYESALGDHGISVMVSWLAGEMELIRDYHLSHENFWRFVQRIFVESAENTLRGEPLPHWDFIDKNRKEEELSEEQESEDKPEKSQVLRVKFRKDDPALNRS